MSVRKHERFAVLQKTNWDYYTISTGSKEGYITDISRNGCMLKTTEVIDFRRWVRVLLRGDDENLTFVLIGRALRCDSKAEVINGNDAILYGYGIEFTFPQILPLSYLDLILALSSKNLTVSSCRILKARSSLRPGSLA